MSTTYRIIKGYKVPSDLAEIIKRAAASWKQSDDYRWQFARDAYDVVGRYLPDATKALARSVGMNSVSSVEGYAKAWELRIALRHIDHLTPLDNLYVSHYVTVAKAWGGKVNQAGNDEELQTYALQWADEILHTASAEDWTIEQLRTMMKGEGVVDSWTNSVEKIISNIENHIINAPYFGVIEWKAVIAANIGKLFVRVLRWATGTDETEDEAIRSLSDRLLSDQTI